jgi:hypothetical protein
MVRRSREGERQDDPYGRLVKPPDWRAHLEDDPVERFSHAWKSTNEYVRARLDERCRTISYEAFCQSPRRTIARACEFVDIDRGEYPDRLPERPVDHNPKSVENLDESEIDTIWAIVGETASQLGYDRLP